MPQHASASRAVTDDRRLPPFSDSQRRSSGDAARLARRGPIFSDLLRLGARALFTRTGSLSSNTATARGTGSGAGAITAASAAGGGGVGVVKEATSMALEAGEIGVVKEGKLPPAAAGAACGGGGVAVALAVAGCWSLEDGEERSCLDSARRRSTMALPTTKTKRALRRRDPACRSTAAAADGTREDDQERKITSASSSPTRSIRYRRRSRSAAPAAAIAVWHRNCCVAAACSPCWCPGPLGRFGFAWVLEGKLERVERFGRAD
uniref:Uncharacterized protein n=1 Tax=Arundo donax TaxID=35708 RepID=A0A0A9FD87_ARUDO